MKSQQTSKRSTKRSQEKEQKSKEDVKSQQTSKRSTKCSQMKKEKSKEDVNFQQTMPREQYFSEKLTEFHRCRSFDVPQNEFDTLFPIQGNANINIIDNKLTSNKVDLQLFPNDVKDKCVGQLPVIVVGDGNCLPRSGSILAFGNELTHKEIRARIAVELACNESIYIDNSYLNSGVSLPDDEKRNLCKTYTMFSDKYMNELLSEKTIRRIFQEETMNVTRLGEYMGVWQLFALSTVLKCPIRSIYPSIGDAVP